MLYLVPTPIGHLEDITLRALNVLRQCDYLLAEDTRETLKLLRHYEIQKPLRPYHAHNEHASTAHIVADLQAGATVALVSDAGTPAISDPGFLLVRACAEAGVEVQCLPGPTAFVPALVSSGLPADKFHFEGFLPHKKGRQTRLQYLATLPQTFVLYESPHRLVKCLGQLAEHCGPERRACVSREISKLYETHHRGSLAELLAHFEAQAPKGEIVISVAGFA